MASPAPVVIPGPPELRPAVVRPQPQKPRPRYWLWILTIIVGLGALAPLLKRKPAARPKPAGPALRTTTVRSGTVERTLRLAGATAASNSVLLLAPQLIGTRHRTGGMAGGMDFSLTLQTLADAGARVKKGQVVAEFDRQYMLLRMDDYRATVTLHEASLKRLRALLDVKRETYNQAIRAAKGALEKARLELRRAPVLSINKAESNQLTFEEADARLKQLEAEAKYVEISEGAAIHRSELDLRVTRMELQRAERSLNKMLVTAPIQGLAVLQTVNRNGEMGQIRQGDQIYPQQPYMSIVDTRSMIVNAVANQVDSEQLRLGLNAHVRFDAYPGLELPAHVVAVGAFTLSGGWRANYVRRIPVRLKLDQLEERVIPDLSVSADLVLETEKDTPILPLESVFSDPKTKEPFAFAQAGDGWEKRPLDLGLANSIEVAVHSGVRAGEVVAADWPLPEGN